MLAETLKAQFGVASTMHNGISGCKEPSPLNVSIDGGLGVGFSTTGDLYFACGLVATIRLAGDFRELEGRPRTHSHHLYAHSARMMVSLVCTCVFVVCS